MNTSPNRVPRGVPAGGQFTVSERAEAAPVIHTPEGDALAEAVVFANEYCEAAGGARPGMCHSAAWNVRERFGWPVVFGARADLPHYWNELPDGRFFDATAAMFDNEEGPLLFAADDDRYQTGSRLLSSRTSERRGVRPHTFMS